MSTNTNHRRVIVESYFDVTATYSDASCEIGIADRRGLRRLSSFMGREMSDGDIRIELRETIANYLFMEGRPVEGTEVEQAAVELADQRDENDSAALRLLGDAKLTLEASNGITAVWAQGGSRIDITHTEDGDTIVLQSYPTGAASTYADVTIAMTDALLDYLAATNE